MRFDFDPEPQDLKAIAQLGESFWGQSDYAEQVLQEILSSVSLLELTPQRAIERTAGLLLERARTHGRQQTLVGGHFFSHPFYRLSFEERLLLVLVHAGGWSYERVARTLKLAHAPKELDRSSDWQACEVEAKIWQARLQLNMGLAAQRLPDFRGKVSFAYPSGPAMLAEGCPPYDPQRPWMQKVLDEEGLTAAERLALQQHLLQCASCSEALKKTRAVYYRAEQEVLQKIGAAEYPELAQIFKQSLLLRYPSRLGFVDGLGVFLSRRETQKMLLLAGLAMVAAAAFLRG